MNPPAFLALLRSRDGLMHVQSNWSRGWFMVGDLLVLLLSGCSWIGICNVVFWFTFFLFTAEGAENGLEFTIVRPFNWIGPRMDFIPGIDGPSEGVPRVLACFSNVCAILVVIFPIYLVFHICVVITSCFSLLQNLLRREPLKLVDGGQSQRTFVYIKDAIEAVMLMIVSYKKNISLFKLIFSMQKKLLINVTSSTGKSC